jgi:hypothetical protein
MHFIKAVLIVDPFTIGRAVILILITATIGYCIGFLGAVVWNRLHSR